MLWCLRDLHSPNEAFLDLSSCVNIVDLLISPRKVVLVVAELALHSLRYIIGSASDNNAEGASDNSTEGAGQAYSSAQATVAV
jgi:hypothetical protein